MSNDVVKEKQGFLKDDSGNRSSMRLLLLIFCFALTAVWSYVSIHSNPPVLADIPSGVLGLVLIFIAGKGYQKLIEPGADGKNPLEKVLTARNNGK